MNIYMIVEGAETETKVYPAWMSILAPNMKRIDDAWGVINYSKSNPGAVCQESYLKKLIDRYAETGHLETFGKWYEFVKNI